MDKKISSVKVSKPKSIYTGTWTKELERQIFDDPRVIEVTEDGEIIPLVEEEARRLTHFDKKIKELRRSGKLILRRADESLADKDNNGRKCKTKNSDVDKIKSKDEEHRLLNASAMPNEALDMKKTECDEGPICGFETVVRKSAEILTDKGENSKASKFSTLSKDTNKFHKFNSKAEEEELKLFLKNVKKMRREKSYESDLSNLFIEPTEINNKSGAMDKECSLRDVCDASFKKSKTQQKQNIEEHEAPLEFKKAKSMQRMKSKHSISSKQEHLSREYNSKFKFSSTDSSKTLQKKEKGEEFVEAAPEGNYHNRLNDRTLSSSAYGTCTTVSSLGSIQKYEDTKFAMEIPKIKHAKQKVVVEERRRRSMGQCTKKCKECGIQENSQLKRISEDLKERICAETAEETSKNVKAQNSTMDISSESVKHMPQDKVAVEIVKTDDLEKNVVLQEVPEKSVEKSNDQSSNGLSQEHTDTASILEVPEKVNSEKKAEKCGENADTKKCSKMVKVKTTKVRKSKKQMRDVATTYEAQQHDELAQKTIETVIVDPKAVQEIDALATTQSKKVSISQVDLTLAIPKALPSEISCTRIIKFYIYLGLILLAIILMPFYIRKDLLDTEKHIEFWDSYFGHYEFTDLEW